ncbi:MAG: hypothetical protein V2A54_12810 [Bacteroidota bacterium]
MQSHSVKFYFCFFLCALSVLCFKETHAQELNTGSWTFLGPTSIPEAQTNYSPTGMGLVGSLWIDPADHNFILAGSNTGGLWKTTDGGKNWNSLTDQCDRVTGVQDISVHPKDKNIMLIACANTSNGRYYGTGIQRTTDGGKNWFTTDLIFEPGYLDDKETVIRKIAFDPNNPKIVFAISQKKIYRSKNAGQTWLVLKQFEEEDLADIEINLKNPGAVCFSGKGLHRFTQKKNKWISISNELLPKEGVQISRIILASCPLRPSVLFLLYEITNIKNPGSKELHLARSNDFGKSIAQKSRLIGVGADYWKMCLEASPSDTNLIYIGGLRMYRSVNAAKTFDVATEPNVKSKKFMHDDIRVLKVLPNEKSDVLYTGNDGGVGLSIDNGKNWQDISGSGLCITQFYSLTLSPDGKRLSGGTQDLGVLSLENNQWFNPGIYADVYRLVYDQTNPKIQYALTNGGITKSINDGKNWSSIGQPPGASRNDKPLLMLSPFSKNFLVGMNEVYKSTDGGKKWIPNSAFVKNFGSSSEAKLISIVVSPVDTLQMYAAFEGPTWDTLIKNKLFYTKDGGKTWADISRGLQPIVYMGISAVTPNTKNFSEIWITFHSLWKGQLIYHSKNSGKNWENASAGIPDIPVSCVRSFDEGKLVLAATDVGVFQWNKETKSWSDYSLNMPHCMISDITADAAQRILYVSTFGRGIWAKKY